MHLVYNMSTKRVCKSVDVYFDEERTVRDILNPSAPNQLQIGFGLNQVEQDDDENEETSHAPDGVFTLTPQTSVERQVNHLSDELEGIWLGLESNQTDSGEMSELTPPPSTSPHPRPVLEQSSQRGHGANRESTQNVQDVQEGLVEETSDIDEG